VKPAVVPDDDAILHVKVWLVGISRMVWRRVLVPTTFTLEELHGVIQVAMGWEGIHLYDFRLRAAHYGSLELGMSSPAITLAAGAAITLTKSYSRLAHLKLET
jgi:hypothetical protein